ncbi:MAG: hypothetical protein ACYDCK_02625 [Thermoplasmatota archaeon]
MEPAARDRLVRRVALCVLVASFGVPLFGFWSWALAGVALALLLVPDETRVAGGIGLCAFAAVLVIGVLLAGTLGGVGLASSHAGDVLGATLVTLAPFAGAAAFVAFAPLRAPFRLRVIAGALIFAAFAMLAFDVAQEDGTHAARYNIPEGVFYLVFLVGAVVLLASLCWEIFRGAPAQSGNSPRW